MEERCSIGIYVNEECHKTLYGTVPKGLTKISEFCNEDQKTIFFRTSSNVTTICKYHEKKILLKFNHLYGQSCCDPLRTHKKTVKKNLREITLQQALSIDNLPHLNLVPGKSLCTNCSKIIFSEQNDKVLSECGEQEQYMAPNDNIEQLDAACSILGVSPASKLKKLSTDKRPLALKSKIDKVSQKIKKNLELCFESKIPENRNTDQPFSPEYEELIIKLKEKCALVSKDDKVKIISLLPQSWPRSKIASEFNVSERLVRLTRELVNEQGILPELGKRIKASISDNTIKKVIAFYEDDTNSRMCPGKKDCVSVYIDDKKVHKQKRLVLSNLNELYASFKSENPDEKIGRSKFCEFRPKWCILAGASGTHTVCVCPHHQNIKLMIDGPKLNLDYKDLLDIIVCDKENYNCMMNDCSDCPGKQALLDMFNFSDECTMLPDNIFHKQWVTADRAEMITVLKTKDEFFESLVEKLEKLKTHHFVSKSQSQFFKNKKSELVDEECLVIADFAENFSFIIQDEIQSFHWVNTQATVHPFVLYFKEDGKLKHKCICILSDHLKHDTAVFYCFQQILTHHIKEVHPNIKKLLYFTDGAASQYKNKKNFANLCNHKKDFDLDAEWHFFGSSHGKNACDGVGGTTKREVAKGSLQRPLNDQILNVDDMFSFCNEKLTKIKYFLIKSEEIAKISETLKKRFDCSATVVGTRSYHKYVPVSESIVRCYFTSDSKEYEDHPVSSSIPLSLKRKDSIACVYDNQWWIGEVIDVSNENDDVMVHFYHPPGPRTSFKLSQEDKVWVPINNVLRKLTPLELTTVTGRSHIISKELSEEISMLLVNHSS